MPNNHVSALAFDSQGSLWIGPTHSYLDRAGGLTVDRKGGVMIPGTATTVLAEQDRAVPSASSAGAGGPWRVQVLGRAGGREA